MAIWMMIAAALSAGCATEAGPRRAASARKPLKEVLQARITRKPLNQLLQQARTTPISLHGTASIVTVQAFCLSNGFWHRFGFFPPVYKWATSHQTIPSRGDGSGRLSSGLALLDCGASLWFPVCCADRISRSFEPVHSALGPGRPPPHDACLSATFTATERQQRDKACRLNMARTGSLCEPWVRYQWIWATAPSLITGGIGLFRWQHSLSAQHARRSTRPRRYSRPTAVRSAAINARMFGRPCRSCRRPSRF